MPFKRAKTKAQRPKTILIKSACTLFLFVLECRFFSSLSAFADLQPFKFFHESVQELKKRSPRYNFTTRGLVSLQEFRILPRFNFRACNPSVLQRAQETLDVNCNRQPLFFKR